VKDENFKLFTLQIKCILAGKKQMKLSGCLGLLGCMQGIILYPSWIQAFIKMISNARNKKAERVSLHLLEDSQKLFDSKIFVTCRQSRRTRVFY
jgi:hypothetical protein